jgi:hypothetical protein
MKPVTATHGRWESAMRIARFVLIALLVMAMPAGGVSATAAQPTLRVRPMPGDAARLLQDGFNRSSTFRRLMDRIRRSDVIVYVRTRPDMPPQAGGSLRFLGCSATDRFVLVSINEAHSWPTKIALLGHELQHVTEVADATDVRSADGLRALYRRIGVRVRADAYDSHAAQVTGQLVREELSTQEHEGVVARHGGSHDTRPGDDVLLAADSIQ